MSPQTAVFFGARISKKVSDSEAFSCKIHYLLVASAIDAATRANAVAFMGYFRIKS